MTTGGYDGSHWLVPVNGNQFASLADLGGVGVQTLNPSVMINPGDTVVVQGPDNSTFTVTNSSASAMAITSTGCQFGG